MLVKNSPTLNTLQHKPGANITFAAGKVYLWFDNDGTLIPYANTRLFEQDMERSGGSEKLGRFYSKLREILSSGKGTVKLNVSTGRRMDSFEAVVSKVRSVGGDYILPDNVVTSEGGELYKKSTVKKCVGILVSPVKKLIDSLRGVKNGERNTLSCYVKDSAKTEHVLQQSQWNLKPLRRRAKILLERHNIKVVDERDLEKPVDPKDIIIHSEEEPIAFIENTGDLSFSIRFKPDASFNKTAFEDISRELAHSLRKHKMKYLIKTKYHDRSNWGRPTIKIVPFADKRPLDKSYEVSKDIEKAKAENDLVIVAGDYINDLPMFNFSSYTSLLKPEEIPLIGIAVNHPSRKRGYNPLVDHARRLENKGKILITEPFSLPQAVKNAIKLYAEKNETFKKALSPELTRSIEEIK